MVAGAANCSTGRELGKGIEMKRNVFVKTSTVVLAVLMLSAFSCSNLNVLQAVVDSTAAAVPILQAAGVPIPPEVPTYISAVANCVGAQTGPPTTQQLLAISACMAKTIAPTLKPGLPQAIVDIVALVSQDVLNYLQQNPPPVVATTPLPAAKAASKPLSSGDVTKLDAMREKARQTVAALQALPKK
jgi:hypothetical protein